MKKYVIRYSDTSPVSIVTLIEGTIDRTLEKHPRKELIVSCRELSPEDIPSSRKHRDAWVDESAESRVDICCEKVKALQLEKLRIARNKALADTDVDMTRALEDNDQGKVGALRTKRQDLRNATEALKAVDVAGKLNDEALIVQLEELTKLT